MDEIKGILFFSSMSRLCKQSTYTYEQILIYYDHVWWLKCLVSLYTYFWVLNIVLSYEIVSKTHFGVHHVFSIQL